MAQDSAFDWLAFYRTLVAAGFTDDRAALQTGIGRLVEEVASAVVEVGVDSGESYYDWMMTGSFVEGWGNNLFRLDGVTGTDSDIDWSQVVKHKVYHLGETCTSIVDCINRKDYKLEDGHIYVKNCSKQPAFDTERHGLRPHTDECHAYPCCSYPKTVLGDKEDGKYNGQVDGKQVCQNFLTILDEQFDNNSPLEDVHFVRASVPGEKNQMRLSCTRQERFIMSQLSTVQGQLFTILKYLVKTDEEPTGEQGKKKSKKILEHLKSFHAKTLLMTLLRDRESWPSETADGDQDEAAADQLRKLVHKALEVLLDSIAKNVCHSEYFATLEGGITGQQRAGPVSRQASQLSRQSPQASEQSPQMSRQTSQSSSAETKKRRPVPQVMDHALLQDCGLYLKVKQRNGSKSSTEAAEAKLHREKLTEILRDLMILLGSDRVNEVQECVAQDKKDLLEKIKNEVSGRIVKEGTLGKVLEKYKDRIESSLKQRESSSAAVDAGARFLFIPLLMLPRISLDTLLEEQKRRDDAKALEEKQQQPPSATQPQQPQQPKASDVLKKAYIDVWIILKSLQAKAPENSDSTERVDAAWKWVASQPCLGTTHQCLRAIKAIREKKTIEEIGAILRENWKPMRWIEVSKVELDQIKNPDFATNFFNKLVRTEDCIWAFHYFLRPKESMSFDYLQPHVLSDAQGAWNESKTWSRKEEVSGKSENVLYIDWVKKCWLKHLVFNEDNKNSRQPNLTVNFDGMLHSLKSCKQFGATADPEFVTFMRDSLFDPRICEEMERSDKKN